mmetsp:Transcript_26164/g.61026  ORF Transcript_26164/g.61026 Transcript_26164/m.61026 type:complete len:116 (+) Transcript_26164:710-1057(+)
MTSGVSKSNASKKTTVLHSLHFVKRFVGFRWMQRVAFRECRPTCMVAVADTAAVMITATPWTLACSAILSLHWPIRQMDAAIDVNRYMYPSKAVLVWMQGVMLATLRLKNVCSQA